jgi:peroxiredoxin
VFSSDLLELGDERRPEPAARLVDASGLGGSLLAGLRQLGAGERGLLGKLLPVKRTTFVIDTDRSVLEVISSEVNMDTHADKALAALRGR